MRHKIIAAVILIVLGLPFLGAGGYMYIDNQSFVKSALYTEGELIEYAVHSDSDGTTYTPIVSFEVDNEIIQFTSKMSSTARPYEVGGRVPVLYQPTDIHNARIDSNMDLVIFPLIFVGTGTLVLLIALVQELF